MLEQCPFCHKLLAAQRISQEQVESNEFKDSLAPAEPPRIAVRRRQFGPTDFPTRDVVTYRVLYRCKFCGKEWTKLSEKEVEIPPDYLEGEQEKAD